MSFRFPPHLYFVLSAIFHYLGPSFAVLLFARVPLEGVAWLRIVSAALVFAVWRRPWYVWVKANNETRWLIVGLGAVLAAMNYSFYFAIDLLPLGTVAAIEFTGPIVLALVGTKTLRNLLALGFTATGVYLLTEVRLTGEPMGFVWAFANALLFTFYIILAHRIAKVGGNTRPVDRLGASMMVAALVITPLGIQDALPAFTDGVLLLAGLGIGLSSSVIPYILDQMAMTQLSRATYALFVALLPATAVLIGVIVLKQVPTGLEMVAVLSVVVGVLVARES